MIKAFQIALLLCLSTAAFATAIARDGSCAAAASSCTFTGTATGDLKLIFATSTSTTIPTLPTGWTSIATLASATGSPAKAFRLGCNDSSSGTDTGSGTWTNATDVVGISYSGTAVKATASCNTIGVGGFASNDAKASTTLNYPTITLANPWGPSWVASFAAANAALPCVPTGMSSVTSIGTGDLASDTNATAKSWPSTNCTVTSETWLSIVVEIRTPVCIDTLYGSDLTCHNNTGLSSSGNSCNAAAGQTAALVAGDTAYGWMDASGAPTGLTDNFGDSWVPVTNLGSTSFPGGSTFEILFQTVAKTTGTATLTGACPGGGTYEIGVVQFHSGTGIVNLLCSSTWQLSGVGVVINTNLSASCASPVGNAVGLSFFDWDNSQPAVVNQTLLSDVGVEQNSGIQSVSAAGTVTATIKTTSTDSIVEGLIVINDGTSSAMPGFSKERKLRRLNPF